MLLREIIDCLWERGYAATPISVIVQETGVNAASLYARFGSKKGIMLAALDLYAKETIDALEACWPRRSREPDKYAPSWNMPWAVLRTRVRGCFLVNTVTNISTDTPDFAMAVADYMGQIRGRIKDALKHAPGLRPEVTPEDAALYVSAGLGPQSHGPDAP
ncbi:MAG: TetR/AcrR family transcriptional regulator [Bilophila wadsworthia]